MPKTKINYSNTTIYKLCCKDISITDIYVGHTTDMRRRKNTHKSSCNNENGKVYNLNVYQFIRNNSGWNNWDMIEVERFEAIDGNDARKKERYWIEELKATLNNKLPLRTKKEYYENNKDNIKEYYEDNKEKIAEQRKEYRRNNREKVLDKQQQYRENNKEKYLEKAKEKITCECGCVICRVLLSKHKKTKKHIDLMLHPNKSDIIHLISAGLVDTQVI